MSVSQKQPKKGKSVSIGSVIKRVPDIGRGLIEFAFHPRQYTATWKSQAANGIPSKEVLGWCLAASVLLFSAYKLPFGSMSDDILKAYGRLPETASHDIPSSSKPTIQHVGWRTGLGVGVSLPELPNKGTSEPQTAIFFFGVSYIVISNVVPNVLVKKQITTLLLILYSLITILCLHFPARALRGSGHFSEALRLALNYYAYVWLSASLLMVCGATFLIHVIGLSGLSMFIGWGLLVIAPMGFVAVRSFFAAFSEYYAFSKKRLVVAVIGSAALSSLLGPLFLLPCLYLLLWTAPLLQALF